MPKDPARTFPLTWFLRALGLNAAAPSVANAGKRLRHVRAAVQRLAGGRA